MLDDYIEFYNESRIKNVGLDEAQRISKESRPSSLGPSKKTSTSPPYAPQCL